VITDVVSTLKNMLDHLDNEIEEHTRQRDFCFAALANETESPARAQVLSSIMLHTEIVHTLWDISDRHNVCPCGMCDPKALRILKAALQKGMLDESRLAQDKRSAKKSSRWSQTHGNHRDGHKRMDMR